MTPKLTTKALLDYFANAISRWSLKNTFYGLTKLPQSVVNCNKFIENLPKGELSETNARQLLEMVELCRAKKYNRTLFCCHDAYEY